jgi:hypothetical protein
MIWEFGFLVVTVMGRLDLLSPICHLVYRLRAAPEQLHLLAGAEAYRMVAIGHWQVARVTAAPMPATVGRTCGQKGWPNLPPSCLSGSQGSRY